MFQSRRAAQIIAIHNPIVPGTACLSLFVGLTLVKNPFGSKLSESEIVKFKHGLY